MLAPVKDALDKCADRETRGLMIREIRKRVEEIVNPGAETLKSQEKIAIKNKNTLCNFLINAHKEGHALVKLGEKWTNFLTKNRLIERRKEQGVRSLHVKHDEDGNIIDQTKRIKIELSNEDVIEFEFTEGDPKSYKFYIKTYERRE